MESEIGRYFEGRLLDTQRLLRALYDLGLGQGPDVHVWIDGRELVFGRNASGAGRGFLRVVPGEVTVVLAFPRGDAIMDPAKRAKGPRGGQTAMTITHASGLDPYVRRMIGSAYDLDA